LFPLCDVTEVNICTYLHPVPGVGQHGYKDEHCCCSNTPCRYRNFN